MNKQKLYIVITPFFPTLDCFRGPFVYDQVKAIERNSNYKVMVFKPTSKLHKELDYEYNGVHVYRFNTLEMPSMLFNGLMNSFNTFSFIKKIKELGIKIDDIAVTHGHTAMFAAYSLALKKLNPSIISVVQHHDPDPFGLRSGRLTGWRFNARFKAKKALNLFNQIDMHLCISRYVETNLKSFPGHAPFDVDKKYLSILKKVRRLKPFVPKNTYILYNGVDTDIFYSKPIAHENFIIGCIANIGDWKDQITLLKAVKKLHEEGETDIKTVLIGSGPGETTCRQFINDNRLENVIEIQKEVHHSILPEKFNTFDIFVLPSYFEGFGCVFTEAAACGIPFIGCKGQGATEYINEDTIDDWTITPGNFTELAAKIKKFKESPCSQRLIESFDINILVKRYLIELDKLSTTLKTK